MHFFLSRIPAVVAFVSVWVWEARAFYPKATTTTRRHNSFVRLFDTTRDVSADSVSTLESLVEERMLQARQGTLEEMTLENRQSLWKLLNKQFKAEERAASKSGSSSSGFGSKAPTVKEEEPTVDFTKYAPKLDKARYGAVIMEQGVARMNGLVRPETADRVLQYVNQSLNEALNPSTETVDEQDLYRQQTKFADVLGKRNRWDMLLPLEESEAILQALSELLLPNESPLRSTLESILGPAPQLYELGVLISDPSSERQMLHADYNYQPSFQPKVAPALTCFCALQDVTPEMGPTTYLPGSATAAHHEDWMQRQDHDAATLQEHFGDSLLTTTPSLLSLLQKGDVSLYNPMTLHCGGANRSAQRRCLFYFSFKNPVYNEEDWPLAYASLRPDLRARQLTLPDIMKILKEWKQQQESKA